MENADCRPQSLKKAPCQSLQFTRLLASSKVHMLKAHLEARGLCLEIIWLRRKIKTSLWQRDISISEENQHGPHLQMRFFVIIVPPSCFLSLSVSYNTLRYEELRHVQSTDNNQLTAKHVKIYRTNSSTKGSQCKKDSQRRCKLFSQKRTAFFHYPIQQSVWEDASKKASIITCITCQNF